MINLQQITQEFKQAMAELYGERLAQIILYGSYARGDSKAVSDIDFLVVLKDSNINLLQELKQIVSRANQLSIKNNIYISSKPTTLSKVQSSKSPFYYWIRKEGKIVT
jgi:predicted nucleotidyltransferase